MVRASKKCWWSFTGDLSHFAKKIKSSQNKSNEPSNQQFTAHRIRADGGWNLFPPNLVDSGSKFYRYTGETMSNWDSLGAV
jgi:hypothetical protein